MSKLLCNNCLVTMYYPFILSGEIYGLFFRSYLRPKSFTPILYRILFIQSLKLTVKVWRIFL